MNYYNQVNKTIKGFLQGLLISCNSGMPSKNLKSLDKFSLSVGLLMFLFLLLSGTDSFSQSYTISAFNGQTVTTCSGIFYDSGGPAADYSDNESLDQWCSAKNTLTKIVQCTYKDTRASDGARPRNSAAASRLT